MNLTDKIHSALQSNQQSRAVPVRTGPARTGSDEEMIEVNFDGMVGPTHNYAGLSHGNLASARHASTVSHPKLAALQGLAKMKLLMDLGVPQAVIPPQPRPDLSSLRQLGFRGTDAEIVQQAHRESPRLLAAVYSSSFMWAANAATISPAPDTANARMHVSPANLLTQFHRSLEPAATAAVLKKLLVADHHDPLPASDSFADEGAANHLRLCDEYRLQGLEIFVHGRDETGGPSRFPARQTRLACDAIVRRHGLDPQATLILKQSPAAIDAGAFHNDVVVASNQDVLLMHRQAFADESAVGEIQKKFAGLTGRALWTFIAEPADISLGAAVSTYLFNSQIVTLPDKTMAVIAPIECRGHAGVQKYLDQILSSGCPVKAVHYVDLRQSMNNGGGPACLRLRVVMRPQDAKLLDEPTHRRLVDVVNQRYRDELGLTDLADPTLISESRETVEQIRLALSS